MGYDSDQFVQAIEEDLFCSICQEVFRNPSEVRCCRQLYCQPCLDDWLQRSRTCPLCRKPLSSGDLVPPHPIIRNMLGRLLIRCDRFKEGCSFTGRLSDLDKHDKEECIYRPVPCPAGCGESVAARSLDSHHRTCTHNRDPHEIHKEFLELQKRMLALEARLALSPLELQNPVQASPSTLPRSPLQPPAELPHGQALFSSPSYQNPVPSTTLATPALIPAPISTPESVPALAPSSVIAPCVHRWVRDCCRICVKCLQCTEYGRTCVCQRDNPSRRVQAGDVCGCGSGVAGCTSCRICWRCAGLPRAPSVR